MKQLTQQLKSGEMQILEVPFPALNPGYIIVRNHYSVISAGTEGKTVTDARKGYIAKARSRQKEVRQVLDMAKTKGWKSTYKFVMNKLEAPSPLGYSTAGEVIAVGRGVTAFKAGDRVACGGAGAYHAEVIAVPVNLAVNVPEEVDLRQAAFSTIGAIAIQGIRQANLSIGECCLIIGMGFIGQITYKILEASGIYPIGLDISQATIDTCKAAGMSNVYHRNTPGLEVLIEKHSHGIGMDAIIITAGTSSLDPVEFAGKVARPKAKVVIVGAVPTGFSRPNYYKKELELRMSYSYGPGRGDPDYEEKGRDYPIGYVRWTENRNMQAFIRFLEEGQLDIAKLITHTFSLEEAPKAYDIILGREEPFGGILIRYDTSKILARDVRLTQIEHLPQDVAIGLIGAGSFAQGILLPSMESHCRFVGIASGRGINAKYIGDKYHFAYLAESAQQLLDDDQINTIVITTRHHLHAEYVEQSLRHNKNVFVQKPLAMNEAELEEIKSTYHSHPGLRLMVGYNRRFSPAVTQLKEMLPSDIPKSIMMRVNAGMLPPSHWVNDPEIGGGRIIGEACHFIDLAMFIAGSPIVSVEADTLSDSANLNNTVSINLKMQNGSIASINYFSNGNKLVAKEYIEVFSGGMAGIIDDFRRLEIVDDKKKRAYRYKSQDKGHAACIRNFLTSVKEGRPCPIPFEELYNSMQATLLVNRSIAENRKIHLNEYDFQVIIDND